MNVREGKEFKFTGQQLKSRIPGYDEREIIYQQAGKNMYTKLYDLPPKSKKFDKFVKDFNASYKAWFASLLWLKRFYSKNKKILSLKTLEP